jgi:predicted HTH transcriptional regulator
MKKDRLLEIIREEISEALNVLVTNKKGETTTMPFNTPDEKKSVTNLKTDSNITNIETTAGQNIKEEELEEDQLNEMAFALKKGLAPSEKLEPRYKKENFKKVVDLILSKVDGKKTMADVARELGVIQQKIRPVVSDLIDAGILETGEAESKSGKDAVNKPGPKAKAKEEPKAKPSSAPKAEPMDDEDVEAAKAAGSDETAKELGSTPEEKKVKFNQFLASVKKNKDDKAKIDGILKLAKDKFKFAKTMMDDLKRAAGREVEV